MTFNIFSSVLGDDGTDIPAPGTEPTYENGVMTDPGNPWIGWPDPNDPKRTIAASGSQRRRARRAQERREAAEVRVGQRAYNRGRSSLARSESQARRRRLILSGALPAVVEMQGYEKPAISPHLLANVIRDEKRRHKLGDPEIAAARADDHREDLEQARLDRAEERRIRRFKEGRPRGKDLRENIFKQFSHYLPTSYWQTDVKDALKAAQA